MEVERFIEEEVNGNERGLRKKVDWRKNGIEVGIEDWDESRDLRFKKRNKRV